MMDSVYSRRLEKWFPNFSMHSASLRNLIKCRFLGSTFRGFKFSGSEVGFRKMHRYNTPQVFLMKVSFGIAFPEPSPRK